MPVLCYEYACFQQVSSLVESAADTSCRFITVAVQAVLRVIINYNSSNYNSNSSTSSSVSSSSNSSSLYCCSALPLLVLVELPSLVDKQYSRTRTEAMISYEVLTYEVHALNKLILSHVDSQLKSESNAVVLLLPRFLLQAATLSVLIDGELTLLQRAAMQ
jgi:hypothetical protein